MQAPHYHVLSIKGCIEDYDGSLIIDSGAEVNVCPVDYATNCETIIEGEYRTPKLRTVTGDAMTIHGIRTVTYQLEYGASMTVVFWACDVDIPVISVSSLRRSGYGVVLDKETYLTYNGQKVSNVYTVRGMFSLYPTKHEKPKFLPENLVAPIHDVGDGAAGGRSSTYEVRWGQPSYYDPGTPTQRDRRLLDHQGQPRYPCSSTTSTTTICAVSRYHGTRGRASPITSRTAAHDPDQVSGQPRRGAYHRRRVAWRRHGESYAEHVDGRDRVRYPRPGQTRTSTATSYRAARGLLGAPGTRLEAYPSESASSRL